MKIIWNTLYVVGELLRRHKIAALCYGRGGIVGVLLGSGGIVGVLLGRGSKVGISDGAGIGGGANIIIGASPSGGTTSQLRSICSNTYVITSMVSIENPGFPKGRPTPPE